MQILLKKTRVTLPLAKIMELEHLEDVHVAFSYLAVNKLIRDKMQKIFN